MIFYDFVTFLVRLHWSGQLGIGLNYKAVLASEVDGAQTEI